VSYSTGNYPVSSYSVAIGDLNGDGKPDLVVASTNTSEGVSVLLGQGNGTFPTAVPYYTGGAYSVAIGDLNGDGKPDLVAAGHRPFGGSPCCWEAAMGRSRRQHPTREAAPSPSRSGI
jgi:hypothetical protein